MGSSITRAAASGAAGAAVLTLLNESARRLLPDAPRMDVMGMRALAHIGPSTLEQDPDRLRRLALFGDLVSNSVYYAGVVGATPSETWWRGVVLGTAAGFGALKIPPQIGLGEPPHSNSRRNQVMTVAWYVLGGLAAAAVANALNKSSRPDDARDLNVDEIRDYLRHHFPHASIGSSTDGLTANEIFTVRESGATRFVEVTKRWLEGDHAGVPVGTAIEEWGLAREVRRLEPNSTLRLATTGFERVS